MMRGSVAVYFVLSLAFALSTAFGQRAPAQREVDPYLSFTGPAIHWPDGPRPRIALGVREHLIESHAVERIVATGPVTLTFSGAGPFRLGQVQPRFSATFVDSRSASAHFHLTFFARREFLPDVSERSLMSYAKGLKLTASDDRVVEIIEAPGSIPEYYHYFSQKPLMLTWSVHVPSTRQKTVRTDYFFDMEEGLLVATVVGSETEQPIARAAAEELMRFAHPGLPQ